MPELLHVKNEPILIASSSMDTQTCLPVINILRERGHNVLFYEADKVADGRASLDVRITNEAGCHLRYDNQAVDLRAIASAWYRRPTMFGYEQPDKALQMSLDGERRKIQYSLWDMVPEEAWLNAPRRMTHADHKLTQLMLAREVGFTIPDTTVTNTWGAIHESLPHDIVVKPTTGVLYSDEGLRTVYTTPLSNDPTQLPTQGNPFPGFWQPHLDKAKEWRITVVGDEVFDAAIYTDQTAKDDWRKHQSSTKKVQFRREAFPDALKAKCHEYLGRIGILYGAFDFTEDADGQVTFLECNANGQYGWLEAELDMPISQAIASELIRKCRS